MKSNDVDMTDDTKFSQLQAAFKKKLDEPYFEEIIKSNFDINGRFLEYCTNGFKPITALHLAFNHKQIKIFNLFLRCGADILANDSSSTVLQKAVQEGHEENKQSLKASVLPFIQSALTVHIDSKILTNPVNQHGISHFHAACATNHIQAVELFLSAGIPVNQAIYEESPILPGYTCLHLAVRYYALETVELLLKRKVNTNLVEKNGLTPMQLLVLRKTELNDLVNYGKLPVNEAVKKELEVSDRILCLLLNAADPLYPYAVCTLTNSYSSPIQELLLPVVNLNQSMDSNSLWYQGYTMLHFAAHCNVDTLILLMARGASMKSIEAKGYTAFDLCLGRYDAECIHSIIANQPDWKNITLSDRKTKLLNVVHAMRNPTEFKTFLQTIKSNVNKLQVPDFSPLWPGSTLLHLAVYFAKHHHLSLVLECLNKGADVTLKDKRGWTPIQLAFRQYKMRTTSLLLQHQKNEENPVDEDNLSHLHIACALKKESLVEKLISEGKDLEMAYKGKRFNSLVKQGATPLHVAVASGSCEIAEMLLNKGANLCATDSSGLTPIHRMLAAKNVKALGAVLLSQPNLKDHPMISIRLNYLHAACYAGHVDAARRFLDLGVGIDVKVWQYTPSRSSFQQFAGFSPLHCAVENNCKEVAQMLVDHGADILAKKDGKSTLFYEILASRNFNFYDIFVTAMKKNYAFQKRMTEDCGITMLHVACYSLDLDFAKHLLNVGLNVNAQTESGSSIWPRFTPLHVLAKRIKDANGNFDEMLKLLLDRGADVTIANADRKTPVHLFLESFELDEWPDNEDYNRLSQLLKAQKDFKVNPMNSEDISHFHIACLINEVDVVKQFLENGVNVNEPIEGCSSHVFAGCTALHLSAGSYSGVSDDVQSQQETVDLLLKYGADIRARDSSGNTPLHSAAECSLINDLELLDKLFKAGADIVAENIRRETPFECLLRSDTATLDVVDWFVKNGYRLNTFKPITEEGIVGQIVDCSTTTTVSEIIERAPEVVEVDEMGRTLVHNIVSISNPEGVRLFYEDIIEKLSRYGCDVDARDRFGKTALHTAVKFRNSQAVFELLESGADVNVADAEGKSAFAYSLQSCENDSEGLLQERKKIVTTFARHVMKLRECGLHVSPLNRSVQVEALKSIGDELRVEPSFNDELNEAKSVKIESTSFVVHDFLSETGAVAAYPSTPQLERIEINKFFESLDERFEDCKGLLKLQHKKATKRWQLNVNATKALRSLLQFSLPELCCWMIFRFLGNSDLNNLIESVEKVDSEDMKMYVD